MAEQEEKKIITAVYMKPSIKKNTKLFAARNLISMSEVIERALLVFLPFYQNKS